jgi:hypothetical protein
VVPAAINLTLAVAVVVATLTHRGASTIRVILIVLMHTVTTIITAIILTLKNTTV